MVGASDDGRLQQLLSQRQSALESLQAAMSTNDVVSHQLSLHQQSAAAAPQVADREPSPFFSTDPPSSTPGRKKRRRRIAEPFPTKLYQLLEQVYEQGRDDVISWVDGGRAFQLHQPDVFVKEIIPSFFRHRSLDSFRRQLNNYSFRRVPGSDEGIFAHEHFVRDRPELLSRMRRADPTEDTNTSENANWSCLRCLAGSLWASLIAPQPLSSDE